MPAKQITDLSPADSFEDGDLLLIRKTGYGIDQNINYSNFVKSISSHFIQGFIAEEEGENKIRLSHASGMPLNKYYNGMKISFVSPITSTGKMQVKIGDLEFTELVGHPVLKYSIKILQDEYIEAFYTVNKTGEGVFCRIKNYDVNSKLTVPELKTPNLMVSAEKPLQTQPPPAPITVAAAPLQVSAYQEPREITVTVGPRGRFKSIKLAIQALTAEYGDRGSTKPHIMVLQDDYVINETIGLSNINLSWITISSTGFIPINIVQDFNYYNPSLFELMNATSPVIAARFLVKEVNHLIGGKNGKINLKGANFKFVDKSLIIAHTQDSIINIDSSTFDYNKNANVKFFGKRFTNNICNFSNSQFINIEGTLVRDDINSHLNIDNCKIHSTSTTERVIQATGTGNINIKNTKITGASSQLTYFVESQSVTLKNCSITSSVPSAQSVVCENYLKRPGHLIIDGGNYQTVVALDHAVIQLINSPTIGNRSTTGNGQIING